jgi:hypothetical protein
VTFVELEAIVRRRIGQSPVIDVDALLREAENEFCERTLCLEVIDTYSTLAWSSGAFSPTYPVPSGFIREFRVEWNGIKLEKGHIKDQSWIYNSDATATTGIPSRYWIENGYFRLLPANSAHGWMTRWYATTNTDTDSLSPVIPSLEHKKLVNRVLAEWFDMQGEPNVSDRYMARFLQDCSDTYYKYKFRRGKQRRISDAAYSDGVASFGVGANIVQATGESDTTNVTVRETLPRSSGTPATGDPLALFQAGTDIVHVSVLVNYTSLPSVAVVPKSDWPVFIKSATLNSGIVTITIGIGGTGTAVEADFDYDVLIF